MCLYIMIVYILLFVLLFLLLLYQLKYGGGKFLFYRFFYVFEKRIFCLQRDQKCTEIHQKYSKTILHCTIVIYYNLK